MKHQNVVAVPRAEGKNGVEAIANLRNILQSTIDAQAAQGWRFVGQIDSVTFENPGCWDSLKGAKRAIIPVNFLVFERDG